jgi:hypothetical protein
VGLLGLALLGAAGCKKKGPSDNIYYLLAFPAGVPIGGEVMLGDKKLGTIEPATTRYEHDELVENSSATVPTNVPLALIRLEPDTWLSDSAASLSVALRSPCGTTKAPLKLTGFTRAREEDIRDTLALGSVHSRQVLIAATVQAPPTRTTQVWVDRGAATSTAVTIGQREVNLGLQVTGVVGLDCKAQHEVKADGKTIGTLVIDPKSPPKGLVISLRKDQCYELNTVLYSYRGGTGGGPDINSAGAPRSESFKAPFALLDVDHIDDYLQPSPDTQRHLLSRTEFVPVACPAEVANPSKAKTGAGSRR